MKLYVTELLDVTLTSVSVLRPQTHKTYFVTTPLYLLPCAVNKGHFCY